MAVPPNNYDPQFFKQATLLVDTIRRYATDQSNFYATRSPVYPANYNLRLGYMPARTSFPVFFDTYQPPVQSPRDYLDTFGAVQYTENDGLTDDAKRQVFQNIGKLLQQMANAYHLRLDVKQIDITETVPKLVYNAFLLSDGTIDPDYSRYIQSTKPQNHDVAQFELIRPDSYDGFEFRDPAEDVLPREDGSIIEPALPKRIIDATSDESDVDEDDIPEQERRYAAEQNRQQSVTILKGRVIPIDALRVRCWYEGPADIPEAIDFPAVPDEIRIQDNSSSFDLFACVSNAMMNGAFQDYNYKSFCTMLVNYCWDYAISDRIGYFVMRMTKYPVGQAQAPREVVATRARLEAKPNGEFYWQMYKYWTVTKRLNDAALASFVQPAINILANEIGLFDGGAGNVLNATQNIKFQMQDRQINYPDLRLACPSLDYEQLVLFPADSFALMRVLVSAIMVTTANKREVLIDPTNKARYNEWTLYDMKEVTTKSSLRMKWRTSALICCMLLYLLPDD
nr:MAG: hypothetical protein [brine shrimp reovirus 1]